ncbi:hypothetical protein RUMCAL_03392 [Ruminococcus callidus ATCC 27760]|uniref:Uncharacterized protein n=1 Tax=Ruminococcus callidus ATCC 27760 TaxID=411473 RepID=U2K4Z7_9FIRM|nr:hypothetical protein RUMCAL_03392 [Ruminococcus callidus ATCC 27760]
MCSHKNEMQVFSARFYADGVKAIPHKERLPTLYGIALGNLPKNLTTHLTAQALCGVALDFLILLCNHRWHRKFLCIRYTCLC